MPVNIDTVYQKVLAIANKEQRGYITPQEFNLYANLAQQEIFEQYFYDLNQQARIPGNEYIHSDVDDILEEKIQVFERVQTSGFSNAIHVNYGYPKPSHAYRVTKLQYNGADVEILKTKDFLDCLNGGPLTRPSDKRPIGNIKTNYIDIRGSDLNVMLKPTYMTYIRKPNQVNWGYFVVGGSALYDSNSSKTKHFQHHESEEIELIYKILKLAGVSMKSADLASSAQNMENTLDQKEKQ